MIHHRHPSAQFAPVANDDAPQRAEQARTFLLIPAAQMPSPETRRALMMRALRGHECSAREVAGTWFVCERQPDTAHERLLTPRQWAIAHGYLSHS